MTRNVRFLARLTMLMALAGTGLFLWVLAISMAPAGDAYRPLVVNLSAIAPGGRLTLSHRRTVYAVLHRTPEQVAAARAGDDAPMPSPQADAERVQRAEWLVVEARPENSYFWTDSYGREYRGRYGGWFAGWGDQHYDLSGRLREGYRATRNLPVPDYYFLDDTIVVIE